MTPVRPVLALATVLFTTAGVAGCGDSGAKPPAAAAQAAEQRSPAPSAPASSAPPSSPVSLPAAEPSKASAATPAPTAAPTQRPRTRLSVVITGDSIPQDLGPMVVAAFTGPQVTVKSEAHPISGLVRNDYFDWVTQAKRVAAERPTTVVMLVGGNDVQGFELPGRRVLAVGTPEWEAEYARRVGAVLDVWKAGGVRQVYWLTMPTTTRAGMNAGIAAMGRAVHKAAAGRSGVTVYDSDTLLGANAGSPAVHGPDGIHLSILGSQMISNALVGRLRVDAGLSPG